MKKCYFYKKTTTSMRLHILPAFRGDAFILEWGDKNQYSIIIDGGFPGTYSHLKQKVEKLENLLAIFVTHVDYDHISGIIKLLENEPPQDLTLYLNTPELILNINKSEEVGYDHGDLLIELINKHNILHKPVFLPNTPKLNIENLKLTVLTPNIDVLTELRNKWDAHRIKEEEDKTNNDNGLVSVDNSDFLSATEILSATEEVENWKYDLINSSSITFIAEFGGKSVLFLADGNPDLIEERLEELKCTIDNPLVVDVVKLSHHGSKHNSTKSLLSRIKTGKVVISTNQKRFRHPNRETIIKVAKCLNRTEEKLNIVFNYSINFDEFITEEERTEYNLEFSVEQLLEI